MGSLQNRLLFYTVPVCLLMLLSAALQSCVAPEREPPDTGGKAVLLGKKSGDQINAAFRYSRDFQQESPEEVIAHIPTSFRTPSGNGPLTLGITLENKLAWLYLEIVNPDHFSRTATLTTTHVRCDRLEIFDIDEHGISLSGDLSRSTPISSRPYRGQEFAFPISLKASDTTRLLMRTSRTLGTMEVDFRLYHENDFLQKKYFSNAWNSFNLAFVFVIILLSLITGLRYGNRLMTNFSIFLFFTFLIYSYILNFWDGFELPRFSGLRNDNLGSFFALLQGIFFHPFGIAILDNYNIRKRFYRKLAWVLMASNGIIALSLLVAAPWTEVVFVRSYTILTFLNIGCLLYITTRVYREAGEKWLLIITILIFAPMLVYLPLRLLYFSEHFYSAVTAPNIPLIAGLLVYFTGKQLLSKLTSKAELERRLTQTKMEMNEMRKEEIGKIGRNLHDQLGNTLASVLGYVNMEVPDLKHVRTLLKQAIQEIRFTSHNLVKDNNLPLSVKIGNIIDRFNDFSPIHFQFYDYSDRRIDRLNEIQQENIYLIVQEALTNAVRYSGAHEMVVQAFGHEDGFRFTLEEDGQGFDPKRKTDGMGIKNMYKRAKFAGLQLTIESSAGNGVNVIIVGKS